MGDNGRTIIVRQLLGLLGQSGGADFESILPALATRVVASGIQISATGVMTGFDADKLDGQHGAYYQSASNLNAGTLPDARFPATLPAASGVNLTALNASNLASGTVPDAQFPATLPAASGVNLTALNASNIASGALADARLSSNIPLKNAANALTDATDSTSSTTGALKTAGGLGVAKALFVGTTASVPRLSVNTSALPSTQIGLVFNGGTDSGLTMNDSAGGTATAMSFQRGGTPVGSVVTSAGATAYNTSSDERLKEDRGLTRDTSVLERTRIHDFVWKSDSSWARGVFAQEAQPVNPRAVTVGGDDPATHPWQVDYSKYVPDLIVGWQQQQARILALERQVSDLQRALQAK
jgi:hypothetical protein